jgi:type I restriction enzyme R subunit
MTPAPEQEARQQIDQLLQAAGWVVQDYKAANIHAGRGVALREFPLPGFGFADYLLYVDGRAAGVIEAKKVGVTLTGVEIQAERYAKGLPQSLPAWHNPLPFSYQSTGIETRFTSGLDPDPRSRPVFAFHRPETLAGWLEEGLAPSPLVGSSTNPASPSRISTSSSPTSAIARSTTSGAMCLNTSMPT